MPGYPQRFIYLHGPQANVATAKKMVREYVESAIPDSAGNAVIGSHKHSYNAASSHGDHHSQNGFDETRAGKAMSKGEGYTQSGSRKERAEAEGLDVNLESSVGSDVRVGPDGQVKQQVTFWLRGWAEENGQSWVVGACGRLALPRAHPPMLPLTPHMQLLTFLHAMSYTRARTHIHTRTLQPCADVDS